VALIAAGYTVYAWVVWAMVSRLRQVPVHLRKCARQRQSRSISIPGADTAQAARISAQRWPAPLPGDVHNMTGHRVEHVGIAEEPVNLASVGRVEFTEHDH
jgi:hypothetical protein